MALPHLFALFEPVGVVTGLQDVAVVGHAIQEGGGHLGVAEDLHPFPELKVGCDDQGGFLVALAEEVKEQGTSGLREWQVAQFVEDDRVDEGELSGERPRFTGLLFPFQWVDPV